MLEKNTFVVKEKAKMLSSRNSYEILDEEGKVIGTAEQKTGGLAMMVGMVLGDPPTQIDFRSVYSTIIQDWFGRDPLPVLDRPSENLGFMQRAAGRTRLVRH